MGDELVNRMEFPIYGISQKAQEKLKQAQPS